MPMTYSDEQRDNIKARVLDGLANGTPLTVLCREEGMPCDDTVRDWGEDDKAFGRGIARAREAGFDVIAMEAKTIIDEPPERVVITSGDDRTESRIDSAAVAWAKNRAEVRLKLLAKWDPKRYGDKTLIGSDPENPLPQGFSVNLVKAPGEAG